VRYLVTGATGFLGANLVRQLLLQGHQVCAVMRNPNRCTENLELESRAIALTDREALTMAAQGCDGIFHVAGTFDPGPGGEENMRAVHIEATEALLYAREKARVPGFVLCSSSITIGFGPLSSPGNEESFLDPDATYGTKGALRVYYDSKLAAEKRVAEAGGVIVNPDYVLGAWDIKPTSGQLLLTLAKHTVPVYPRGGKCFIDADDCAIGHMLAMEKGRPGRRYLLGNHNVSYRKFMQQCASVAGRRGPFLPVPGIALKGAGLVGRLLQRADPHRFAGLEPHVLQAMQQDRYRSGKRSLEELGVPKTPLEISIKKAWDWFAANGYIQP
jgi:nucleoside-diphosphate-sugar epimerase